MFLIRQIFLPSGSRKSLLFWNWTAGILCGLLNLGCDSAPSSPAPPAEEVVQPESVEVEIVAGGREINKSDALKPMPAEPEMTSEPLPQVAPKSVTEPRFSEAELNELGIEVFSSAQFELRSDAVQPSNEGEFQRLPGYVDQLISWVQSKREDRIPSHELKSLQGSIMEDPALFLQAGLAPEELKDVRHGLYRGQEFWMREQQTDYFRRHLLFHEVVHCLLDVQGYAIPVWFHEGMAERIAVHQIDEKGNVLFAQVPGDSQVDGGFGRMQLIREEIDAGRFKTLNAVQEIEPREFYSGDTSYAWAWALCYFLAEHPQTKEQFTLLTEAKSAQQFKQMTNEMLSHQTDRLKADWLVFTSQLEPGFNFQKMLIDWISRSQQTSADVSFSLDADHNWQNSGYQVMAGKTYQITARGQYVVDDDPKDWICEPQGVSVEYVDGFPLGMVQAVIYDSESADAQKERVFLKPIPIGSERSLTAPKSGTLFFRINDHANSWENNRGEIAIQIQARSASE
ncbi:hypothetical protein [Rubinisphaera sp.]|uniref:hypothetical protein n=1 Tax=Rubinisphaera sp. TaxID=2024857 RepID=UPI000C0C8284|nr:hypothetical protein [Rubinisphaera sp.]MBV09648.1 hypothetical protein [Rubinisphaera sp.]HCS54983.1 hypothetical protein [Planctomycetaceae bacterium]|tara:strand:- start:7788 stop:9320 length:1533 start_codon:yes stop_codon:yes gene_type:complete